MEKGDRTMDIVVLKNAIMKLDSFNVDICTLLDDELTDDHRADLITIRDLSVSTLVRLISDLRELTGTDETELIDDLRGIDDQAIDSYPDDEYWNSDDTDDPMDIVIDT